MSRIPDNVHKLKGTYQPVRHGKASEKPAIEPVNEVPEAPKMLNKAQKEHYYRVANWLCKYGMLTEVNWSSVVQYSILFDKLLTELEGMKAEYHAQFRMLQVELGLTPSSQGKLRLIGGNKKSEPDDPWEKL